MKTNEQLINNIVGQLGGIRTMMGKNAEVFDVITQMKATKSALNSLMNKYIEQNFWELISKCENQEEVCKKFFAELINNN